MLIRIVGGKNKDQYPKLKLSVCTGCKIATYCVGVISIHSRCATCSRRIIRIQSATCQKTHWPTHKPLCLKRRRLQEEREKLDEQALELAQLTRTPILTPSEVTVELRAFTQKFNAALFQVGYNALRLHKLQNTWKDLIVYVQLTRLENLPPDSKPWARYIVDFVSPLPAQYMAERWDSDGKYGFLETKAAQEQEQVSRGYLGAITIIISATVPAMDVLMHNVTCIGFGAHSKAALQIEEDWQQTFMDAVERMCGRTPSAREG